MNKSAALSLVPILALPVVAEATPAALSPQILALARTCAPDIHPLTLAYLVRAESHNNQYAINVNGGNSLPRQPATEQDARDAIALLNKRGWNYDVGFAQINSGNFRSLGLTGEQLLDPCTNLRAAALILGNCYARAVQAVGEGQGALQRALSCYNTDSQSKGFANGYVKRVVAQVRYKVPELMDGPINANDAGAPTSPSASSATPVRRQAVAAVVPAQPAADPATQGGEQGAAGQIEEGAFAHPELGAFMSRVSAKGSQ
ncbi:lytic transglycosylase domain-containing protein [Trinickia sp. YCB016]